MPKNQYQMVENNGIKVRRVLTEKLWRRYNMNRLMERFNPSNNQSFDEYAHEQYEAYVSGKAQKARRY